MAITFKFVHGLWKKINMGEWRFVEKALPAEQTVAISVNDFFDGVVEMIRIRLDLGILTPVELTYIPPPFVLHPNEVFPYPKNVTCDRDVQEMVNVSPYMGEPLLFVTLGPEDVAKYQFQCRKTFTISDNTYLNEGVTEEEHRDAIKALVGGHPIVCSKRMLELMFNEPQLLLVYRVALEIQLVYPILADPDGSETGIEYPNVPVDVLSVGLENPPYSPVDHFNNAENNEVIYGETVNVANLDNGYPNLDDTIPFENETIISFEPEVQQPVENITFDEYNGYEFYVAATQRSTEGQLGLPRVPNMRVSAPMQPTILVIPDDDTGSDTGSSTEIYDNLNTMNVAPIGTVEAEGEHENGNVNGIDVELGQVATNVDDVNNGNVNGVDVELGNKPFYHAIVRLGKI